MAAEAQENVGARSMLATNLRPLTNHVINRYLDQLVNDGHSRTDLNRMLENVVECALDDALIAYKNDPSYKIGTYYSWHLRQHTAHWFKKYAAGDTADF